MAILKCVVISPQACRVYKGIRFFAENCVLVISIVLYFADVCFLALECLPIQSETSGKCDK